MILNIFKSRGKLYPLLFALGVVVFWVLRVHYWDITSEPIFSDMAGFEHVARGILHNFDFSWSEFWQSYNPPTLAVMRAIQLAVLGEDFRAWQIFQLTFVFISLIWLVLEIIEGSKSPWLGLGLLWVVALSKSSIFWSLKLAREGVGEGFVYLCVAAMLYALRSRRAVSFFVAGCIYTAAMLNRPNFVSIVPLVCGGFLLSEYLKTRHSPDKRASIKQTWVLLAALLLGVLLVWSPWLIRSYRIYGHIVPFSTQAPYSFFWEMGTFNVRMPDGSVITTSVAELYKEAPNFRNDYELAEYGNSLILPWLQDNRRWYINFVLFNRIGRTITQQNEDLTMVSRTDLFPGLLNQVLIDKSLGLVILGIVGLFLLAVKYPNFYVVPITVLGPWLTATLFYGYPRMLDPHVPMILLGNFVLLGYARVYAANTAEKIGWRDRLQAWVTAHMPVLVMTSLGLNVLLILGLFGTNLFLDSKLEQMHFLLVEGPHSPNELIVSSLTGNNYLFDIYDTSAAKKIEFVNGEIDGQGKIYLHPDQKVNVLLLQGQSSYSQRLPADGAITLRFFGDTTSGRIRIVWRGSIKDVNLFNSKPGGEWQEIQVP